VDDFKSSKTDGATTPDALAKAIVVLAQPTVAKQVERFAPRWFGYNNPTLKDVEEREARATVEGFLKAMLERQLLGQIQTEVTNRVQRAMGSYTLTEAQARTLLRSQAFQAELSDWVAQALNAEALDQMVRDALASPAQMERMGSEVLKLLDKRIADQLTAHAQAARAASDKAHQAALDAAIAQAGAKAEAWMTDSTALAGIIRAHIPDVETVKDLVSEDSIRAMLIRLGLIKQMDITIRRPDGTTVKFDRSHVMFDAVLAASQAGPVMMVGPAGCGKTLLAKQVAEALGLPFYFNGAISSEYKVTGYKDAGGTYHTTPFRQAFEHGGVYLFDEVDGSHPQAFLTLNAALANGMMDFPDKTVQMHPNFVCLAAANTYGRGADRKYVGRNALDAASLDRFTVMTMEYDEDLELNITDNPDWTRKVQGWRAAALALRIDHIISTRACVRGAHLLALGMPEEVVADAVVWKGLDRDDVKKILAKSAPAQK
jgi:hypothetical protein